MPSYEEEKPLGGLLPKVTPWATVAWLPVIIGFPHWTTIRRNRRRKHAATHNIHHHHYRWDIILFHLQYIYKLFSCNYNKQKEELFCFYPFSAAWTVVCCVLDSAREKRKDNRVQITENREQITDNKTLFCHSDRAQRRGISWLYSTAYFTLDLLSYILFVVVLSCSFGPKRTKRPGTAKTVATAFRSCRRGEHSAGSCLPQTTFRSVIGDKRTRFPRHNNNANMHRSNSFYPASAAWTVVCCVLDSAGWF